jgi:cell division inhibitor SepF
MSRKLAADEYVEPNDTWIARLRDRWFGESEEDDVDDDVPFKASTPSAPPSPRPAPRKSPSPAGNPLQLVRGARSGQITRRMPKSLADAERAAENLKDGLPVILNLERADDELARRVVDFISGVTYALNGSYERVGDKVFLFTPSSIIIADEDEVEPTNKGLFVEADGL